MSDSWNARRILTELCDADLRRKILTLFWKASDAQSRALATAHLAKLMRFRDEAMRKLPAEKKADMLVTRMAMPELEQTLEIGLMAYLTTGKQEMLAAFLDEWKIPHENGSIENDEYTTPTLTDVQKSVETLASRFELRDMLIYLAAAGLLMGESQTGWREATWPVVDAMSSKVESSESA